MSNLSELLPAGGAAKEIEAVASGTLPNGTPVIIKSDGTVEVIVETTNTISQAVPLGSETQFDSHADWTSVKYDPFNAGRFVIAWQDAGNSGYGSMIVGNTSGGTITFGSQIFFNSLASANIDIAFDHKKENQFVVVWQGSPDPPERDGGSARAGMLNSTNGVASWGAAITWITTQRTFYNKVEFDPFLAGRFVVMYSDPDGSNTGEAICGNIDSSSTIAFGSHVQFSTGAIEENTSISFDPNTQNKFLVFYTATDASTYPRAVVGVLSGTNTITFGTGVTFYSGGDCPNMHGTYDPHEANKFVCAFDNGATWGKAIVGTVSGTTSSFGSLSQFSSSSTGYCEISFDPNTSGKFVIAWTDWDNSINGVVSLGTRSSNSLSFLTKITINSGGTYRAKPAFDYKNNGRFVVAYKDGADGNKGKAIICQIASSSTSTTLTTDNFFGITAAAIANTATGVVIPKGGVAANLTSLTTGSTYYVQGDGTVSTVSTSPAVNIGKAISATSLILKG